MIRGGITILAKTNRISNAANANEIDLDLIGNADEIDLELILESISEMHQGPVYNSFLDTDEKTALSASDMQQEEFGDYSYMANNRKD